MESGEKLTEAFEEDLSTLSTARLRLLEAQVFDDQTHLECHAEAEAGADETDLLENLMEHNREEVRCPEHLPPALALLPSRQLGGCGEGESIFSS